MSQAKVITNRDRLLASKNKGRSIDLDLEIDCDDPELRGDGFVRVTVRQPNVGQRGEILAAGKIGKDGGDFTDAMLEGVIQCTFDRGTNTQTFAGEDAAALRIQYPGGWLDALTEAVGKLLNVKAEDAEKKSGTSPKPG